MAFKMRGFSAFNMNGNTDGQDIEPTKKQERKSKRQRNKYNKEALKNKPLSDAQIQNLTNQMSKLDKNSDQYKEFNKLLKLNKRINK